MMLPTKILRLLICFCILATAAQHAAAQNKKSFPDAYRRYVKGIFKNYDLDGDDLLDADEVGKMRRKPKGADANCLLYTSPSPRDKRQSRMPSSA